MDIDYLLALQNLREGAPDILSGFLSLLSLIADGPGLVAIVMIVYWCVNKRAGQFTMAAFMTSNLICQFIKNLVCVYRPWVRDPRITPPESVLEGAGGYSFPSGHAAGATSSLGSFAWILRKKYLVWSIVLVVIALLIVFSRNFLGVHTPQDVLVAVGIGVLAIWLTIRFFRWFEDNEDKDWLVAAAAIAVSLITLIIVIVKPYPLDYVDGKLLVDPIEMQKGSFEASGVVIGVVLGWLLERRMVQFSTDSASIDLRGRLIRGIVGIVIVGIVYFVGNALFKAVFGLLWGKLLAMAVLTFVAMFVVPFVFTWLEQTRFVPYAGVPAPRSAGSRSGRESYAGRSDSRSSGRSGGRSGERSGGRSSERPGRRSGERGSSQRSGRSSAGRGSYGRTQRSSSQHPRTRTEPTRQPRDAREAYEPREARDAREAYESQDAREICDARGAYEPQGAREARDAREAYEPQGAREIRDAREAYEPQQTRRYSEAEEPLTQRSAYEPSSRSEVAEELKPWQDSAPASTRRSEMLGSLPNIEPAGASEPMPERELDRPVLNSGDLPSL